MQAELEKVSSLLDAAANSFRVKVDEDGCSRLSEAASILERMLAQSSEAEAERPRILKAAA